MQYLKQSTAVTLKLGPFLDDTDGKTAEASLTIAQADVRLSKNGGDIAQKTESTSCTHDELGIYGCPVDITDTNTLGRLQLFIHESGALPVWHEYMVLPANVFDSMFSTDKLEVDLLQMGGVAQSATDLKDFADAGYDPSANKIEGCKVNDDMVGTDSAALAATALSNATWTDAKAGYLANINNANLATIADISTLTATEIAYLDAGVSSRSSHSAADVWAVVTRALTDKSGFALSSAGITAIWQKNISAYAGAGYAGTYLKTVYDDWLNAGRLDLILDAIAADVVNIDGDAMRGTDSANTTTPPTVNAIADQVWDEILTGASHNISTSAGRRLRDLSALSIHSGTAQAGTTTTITLVADADGGDGVFNRNLIVIISGTGAGQTRTIVDYNDTTKVCIIDRDWRITPDATSEYQILADDTPLVVDHGVAQAGTATTITLRDYASAINDTYLCNIVSIIAGTGCGQARLVGGYNGSTKVVTICGDNWVTNPDNTSVYVMVPYGTTCASCMGTYALSQVNAECDTALADFGKTGYALSAAGVDAILDEVVEDTTTFRQMLRLFMSALSGKSAGGGTVTLTFRDAADAKDRITATVDANGNRTSMVLDGT